MLSLGASVAQARPVRPLRPADRLHALCRDHEPAASSSLGRRRRHRPLQAPADRRRLAGAGRRDPLRQAADREARASATARSRAGWRCRSASPAGPVTLTLGPEVDLLADADGDGRHAALVNLVNLSAPVAPRLTLGRRAVDQPISIRPTRSDWPRPTPPSLMRCPARSNSTPAPISASTATRRTSSSTLELRSASRIELAALASAEGRQNAHPRDGDD